LLDYLGDFARRRGWTTQRHRRTVEGLEER
jgi:hypothetical protein